MAADAAADAEVNEVLPLVLWLLLMLMLALLVMATAPPPPPALPTLPTVVGRGTTPADVGTTGARPTTVEPALDTVTAAVAAAGDERGRLQMFLTFPGPCLPLPPPPPPDDDEVVVVAAADDAEAVLLLLEEAIAELVEKVGKLLAMLLELMEFVAATAAVPKETEDVVLEFVDDDVAQWSGKSHGPSLKIKENTQT